MDWSAKDYKLNGPEGGILSQYRIYMDSVKPEIKLSKDDNSENPITLNYGDKKAYLKVSDKRDENKPGRIEKIKIFANGKEFDQSKNLKDFARDDKIEIKVIASDYARNTSVKIFELDLDKDEITEVENKDVKVKVNGNEESVKQGEDFVLPEYKGNVEANKKFIGWNVRGVTQKPGHIFLTKEDIEIEPVFEEVSQKKYTVTFEANGGSGKIPSQTVTENEEVELPQNTFVAPEGKVFDAWIVSGDRNKKNVGEKIKVNSDITITASWKDIKEEKPADENKKPSEDNYPDKKENESNNNSNKENNYPLIKNRNHEKTSPVFTNSGINNNQGSIFSTKNENTSGLENHWAKDAINNTVNKGYFKDIAELNNFMPDKNLTRAEFVTILGRVANVDISKYKNKVFSDVDKNILLGLLFIALFVKTGLVFS